MITTEEKERVWGNLKQMIIENPKDVSEKLHDLLSELRKSKIEKIVEEDFAHYHDVFKALA